MSGQSIALCTSVSEIASSEDSCSESLAEGDEEVEGQGDIVSEDLLLHSGMEA